MGWNSYNPGAMSPCKGCTIRALNCHSSCLGYANFKLKVDVVSENRANSRREDDILIESNIRRKKKFEYPRAKKIGQL